MKIGVRWFCLLNDRVAIRIVPSVVQVAIAIVPSETARIVTGIEL